MQLINLVIGLVAATVPFAAGSEVFSFPNDLTAGLAKAQFSVTQDTVNRALDAPHLSPRPNQTSFNWWAFDAVNPANLNESVSIIFYLATNASFPFRSTATDSVSADVWISYADGSRDAITVNPLKESDSATITVDGALTSGNWSYGGLSFVQLGQIFGPMEFGIQMQPIGPYGISGEFTFQSAALPHLPCTTNTKEVGQSLECVPHVGWTNIFPDAKADIQLYVNSRGSNKHVVFKDGIGYHDTKWGDIPFHHSVKDWYSGHARLGVYTLVWLQATNHDGKKYSNVYVTKNNVEVIVACENDEQGAPEVPLLIVNSDETCTTITINANGTPLPVTVEKTRIVHRESGPFTRWTGKVQGSFDAEKIEGTASFEEFHF